MVVILPIDAAPSGRQCWSSPQGPLLHFPEVGVDTILEIIKILSTYAFFLLLVVAVTVFVIALGVVLFAVGEGFTIRRSNEEFT
jgi:hypothetical protein